MAEKDQKKKEVKCGWCGKVYGHLSTLSAHKKEVHRDKYKPCVYRHDTPPCTRTFEGNRSMLNHLISDHYGFACPIPSCQGLVCGVSSAKPASRRGTVRRHTKAHEAEEITEFLSSGNIPKQGDIPAFVAPKKTPKKKQTSVLGKKRARTEKKEKGEKEVNKKGATAVSQRETSGSVYSRVQVIVKSGF